MIEAVNLAEKLGQLPECWSPRIVGALNGQELKVARLKGEFLWHHHAEADEFFLVLEGELRILLRDGEVRLRTGEFTIVPRGVEHCPVADEECRVLLLEPAGTLNTGNVRDARTVEDPERI